MLKRIVFVSLVGLFVAATGWAEEPPARPPLTLSAAIGTALRNNPAIQEAENREKMAEEGLKSSRAEFFAKASASYSYTRLQDAPYQEIAGMGPQTVGDTDNYHWDVTLVQPLFKGFGIWSRHGLSKADVAIRALEREQTRSDVVRDVKTAYYEALLATRIEDVAAGNVKTLESQARDSQGFFDHGIIAKNDLLKSKIALAAALQEREKAGADARIALARLNIIMGAPINEVPILAPVAVAVRESADVSALMDEAVKNRPELKIMEQGLAKVSQRITLSRSSAYPEVALVGRYEQNGNSPSATENEFTNDHNTSVSVQARWTFFEWGKTRADVSGTRYEKWALDDKKRWAEDQVRLETKQAYLDVKVSEKNIKTAEEALGQARENFRITKAQYLLHVTTATEVLDAQTYLSRAESDYHKALYGYMISSARLDRATGRTMEQ